MTILLTGGGSGGHITPILAVAEELKAIKPDCKIVYIGERSGKFASLTKEHTAIDEIYTIFAGKFRRYHGQSWIDRLFDVKTNALNMRDAIYVVLGLVQSLRLLRQIKPNVILLKGGFVGVPIGLAAACGRRPFMTHDSDALPGLANRLVSRWASLHATALSAEYYPYTVTKIRPVGVLVEPNYQPVTPELQKQYKHALGIPEDAPMLLITGGSSGAERINQAITKLIDSLLSEQSKLYVFHQVGKGKMSVYSNYTHERLRVVEFLKPMYQYMGAADLVVCRASGNTLAELGIQGKAVIAIPNPDLTGGHQLKNAQRLQEQQAAVVIYEKELNNSQQHLFDAIVELLGDRSARKKLGLTLQSITKKGAAKKLALLLLEIANKKQDVQTQDFTTTAS
ncbi:glycosyltransferase [Candidatus Saccharibacteria bacterium]|nr:glycosyltransferase [Candidatus Saccharibacteria bacterium]MBI3338294.1 glycosyltransferase [Candidatus Saccharibacteria bacterium]